MKNLPLVYNSRHSEDGALDHPPADPKEKVDPMKRAVRAFLLLVGLVGTLAYAAVVPSAPTPGGPIPLCPPRIPNCDA